MNRESPSEYGERIVKAEERVEAARTELHRAINDLRATVSETLAAWMYERRLTSWGTSTGLHRPDDRDTTWPRDAA